MLSARGEEYDRIRGFELGVDDYVVKPFSPKELMLRVAAILRRAGEHEDLREVYTVEGITADFTGRRVLVDGAELGEDCQVQTTETAARSSWWTAAWASPTGTCTASTW